MSLQPYLRSVHQAAVHALTCKNRRLFGLAAVLGVCFALPGHAAPTANLRLDLALSARPASGQAEAPLHRPDAPALRLGLASGLARALEGTSALSTGSTEALLFEAVTLHRQGRLAQAEALYRQLLDQADPPPAAHLGLARLLAARSGPAIAAAHLEQACGQRPDAYLAAEAGRWWAVAGDAPRARACLEKGAAVLTPADQALLAGLYLQAGQYAEAAAAYRRALRAQDHALWWLGLAHALQAIGDIAGAHAAYRYALASPQLPPEAADYARQQLDGG